MHRAVGGSTAPFFRFPFLRDSPELLKYLAGRNIAVFSTDIDTFDFKGPQPEALVKHVMALLEKRGKGIILMHDIQPHTAAALPEILKQLKAKDYKVVQVTANAPVQTLPEFEALIEKDMKGMPTELSQRADDVRYKDDWWRTVSVMASERKSSRRRVRFGFVLPIKRKKCLYRLLGISTEARSTRLALRLFIVAQAPPREWIGTQYTVPAIIFYHEREPAMRAFKMHNFHDIPHEISAENYIPQ